MPELFHLDGEVEELGRSGRPGNGVGGDRDQFCVARVGVVVMVISSCLSEVSTSFPFVVNG